MKNFTAIPNQIIEATHLRSGVATWIRFKAQHKAILMALAKHVKGTDWTQWVYPGFPLLSRMTGLSKSTLTKRISELENSGVISVHRPAKSNPKKVMPNNKYRLNFAKEVLEQATSVRTDLAVTAGPNNKTRVAEGHFKELQQLEWPGDFTRELVKKCKQKMSKQKSIPFTEEDLQKVAVYGRLLKLKGPSWAKDLDPKGLNTLYTNAKELIDFIPLTTADKEDPIVFPIRCYLATRQEFEEQCHEREMDFVRQELRDLGKPNNFLTAVIRDLEGEISRQRKEKNDRWLRGSLNYDS